MIHFKRILDFFLYSNIFISICAAAMAAETYFLIRTDINWLYISFVFSSTLSLYNFPVLISGTFSAEQIERHSWIYQNKKLLVILFALASAAAGVLVFFFPLKFTLYFIPVALFAFAYFFPQTHLRNIAGLKAGIVALVWTCVTAIYPLLLNSDFELSRILGNASREIVLQNFLFIFPLCVIFNVRDIEADRDAGVKTIPVIYGIKATIALCLISLALFFALVIFTPLFQEVRIGLLLSAAASGILILYASEKRSDYYYSLWVDGTILLQAGLVLGISAL